MQVQSSTASTKLRTLSPQEAAWENFRRHVMTLNKLEVAPENLRHYYRLVESWRALRKVYVTARKVTRTKPGVRNPGLERWAKQTAHFNDSFWGKDLGHWVGEGDGKKWMPDRSARAGLKPAVLRVMLAYSKLRDRWHYHTPAGKEARRLSAKRNYAKPEGKAKKAAYQASEAGKASRAKALKARDRKRAVDRGLAQQALYDSWATDNAIEEALQDV